MRQKLAVVLIAFLCCFSFGCVVATSTKLSDISPKGSITAAADPIVLSFEQDTSPSAAGSAPPTTVDFATACPANPTSAASCATSLGSTALSCGTACIATYQLPAPLALGTYEIYAFTTLGASNSIVHAVESVLPVASEVVVPVPAPTPFGSPVELMPTIDPFPLTGAAGQMGTFEIFASTGNVSLGTAYVTPTGFDGRGTVASPGLGIALDLGNNNIYGVYHSPAVTFPVQSSGHSAVVTAVVVPAATQIAVTASQFVSGSPVTLTATLAATVDALGFPAGTTFSGTASDSATATFFADGNPIGTGTYAPTALGVTAPPQFTLSTTLTDAPHDITVSYTGNTRFLASTSNTLTILPSNASGTTMTLTSSESPAPYGDGITFTATITTTAGNPSGTVTFRDTTNGTVDLGTSPVTAGPGTGTATFVAHGIAPGDHTIVALYGGDAGHPGGALASFTQTVDKATATITFTSSAPLSVYGESVSISVKVTAAATLTGKLTIFDNNVQIGSTTGGNVSNTSSILPVGTHQLRAVYSGDPNVTDQSADLTQVVSKATSKVALSASSAATSQNANVTFTAIVTAVAPGVATPTGTVAFLDGTTQLGTGTIGAGGVATFSTSAIGNGDHTITASFPGDDHLTAGSASLDHRVDNFVATVLVSASPQQATFGTPVTLSTTVQGAIGAPGGTVTYHIDSTPVGTATFDTTGAASFTTSTLPVGASTITADYSGDASYPSASGTVTVVITVGSTTTALASSANPATLGAPVTFTATVTAPGAQPTGDVVFFDGSLAIGTSSLANGAATLTVNNLMAGAHPIVATYQGSSSYTASHSATLTENIGGTTNGPAATADAGATTAPADAGAVSVTGGGGGDSGCSSSPSSPVSGIGFGLATVLVLGAMRRRKRLAA